MIVIICAKYKKNWSRTVEATKRTRFSKSRQNDLEDIGQGQRSSHGTHPLMLLIICTKYGKNPSWTVDGSGSGGNWPKTTSQKKTKSKLQILKIRQNFKFLNFETGITRDTPSEVKIRCANMKWIRWVLLKIQSGHDSVHRRTDGQTDKVIPVYPPFNFVDAGGIKIGRGFNLSSGTTMEFAAKKIANC